MFQLLGSLVNRFWWGFIGLWLIVLIAAWFVAPAWNDVTASGEINFMPPEAPSRRGDKLLQQAFPLEYSSSNIVVVLWRENEELQDKDKAFIREQIVPGLGMAFRESKWDDAVVTIATLAQQGVGALLVSPDKRATLVVAELNTGFQELKNNDIVDQVEKYFQVLEAKDALPKGLRVAVTGSATAGRDLELAQEQSAENIERWTIAIVVVLLLLLYRAPLVALIPLATVFVSVSIALMLLSSLAGTGLFQPARDLGIFITVLAYGAGVDYCLFLIARYREEIDHGHHGSEAIVRTLKGVGAAITASAATVIFGIAMLAWAQFGKIHEAGIVIPIALVIVLLACLTFAASLLRWADCWAFWPQRGGDRPEDKPCQNSWVGTLGQPLLPNVWQKLGPMLLRSPGAIWLGSLAVLAPFAVVGLVNHDKTNFNPLSELPDHAASVRGTDVLMKHFPPGMLGPVTVLIRDERVDFSSPEGIALVAHMTEDLRARKEALQISDVRSIAQPLGTTEAVQQILHKYKGVKRDIQARAGSHYISQAQGHARHVTRIEIALKTDPLAQESIALLDQLKAAVRASMPPSLASAQVEFAGSTASLYDLSEMKKHDLTLIQYLVPGVVLMLLLIMLRRLVISLYLVFSVIFSYLATMGATYLVFSWLQGPDFTGLDWKVPIFLFTILVAVGEDYNIFLLMRIKEERDAHGPIKAIPHGLAQTGRIISSCGFLMAGTFASLFSGTLEAMKQLGFALALGVLVDTLLVRPVLVPTFLMLLQRLFPGPLGTFMSLGRYRKHRDILIHN